MAITRGYRAQGACPDGGTPLLKPVIATAGDMVDVLADGTLQGKKQPRRAGPPGHTG
jgi:hypothetical protein